MNPLAMTYEEFRLLFRRRYGRRADAATWYRRLFETVQNAPAPAVGSHADLNRWIREDFSIELPRIVARQAQDGVTKLVLALHDGLEIETVIMPMHRHVTVCISSQVGCRMGCLFCRTGRMGLLRQLTSAEIVAQAYLVKTLGFDVRNVVFMGMGEPLDNCGPVMQAIQVLNDQRGLNIGLRRITLSTIGLVPALEHLAARNWPLLGVALSLNAAEENLRHHLMPATGHYSLDEVLRTLQTFRLAKGRVFFISYVLIKDVNDSEYHALRTAALLKGLPVKLNLIVYNPGEDSIYQAPSQERVEGFRRILVGEHYFVRLRGAKGGHIQAACGQLGSKSTGIRDAPS